MVAADQAEEILIDVDLIAKVKLNGDFGSIDSGVENF